MSLSFTPLSASACAAIVSRQGLAALPPRSDQTPGEARLPRRPPSYPMGSRGRTERVDIHIPYSDHISIAELYDRPRWIKSYCSREVDQSRGITYTTARMRPILLLVLGLLLASATYIYLFVGRREKNLPPGPPTIPILGNVHQIPKRGAHFQFTRWAKQHGEIYSLKLGTGNAVVSAYALSCCGQMRLMVTTGCYKSTTGQGACG